MSPILLLFGFGVLVLDGYLAYDTAPIISCLQDNHKKLPNMKMEWKAALAKSAQISALKKFKLVGEVQNIEYNTKKHKTLAVLFHMKSGEYISESCTQYLESQKLKETMDSLKGRDTKVGCAIEYDATEIIVYCIYKYKEQ